MCFAGSEVSPEGGMVNRNAAMLLPWNGDLCASGALPSAEGGVSGGRLQLPRPRHRLQEVVFAIGQAGRNHHAGHGRGMREEGPIRPTALETSPGRAGIL